MTRTLAAIALAAALGFSGSANAISFTIAPGYGTFSDSARTLPTFEFETGETIFGRFALGLEADDDDPATYIPTYDGPMELIGMDAVDDLTGDPVDPADFLVGGLFTPTAPHTPTLMYLDFTVEFDVTGAFTLFAFSSPAIVLPGVGVPVIDLDPGPLALFVEITASTEGVPTPGALALLGLGLIGLGVRRRA